MNIYIETEIQRPILSGPVQYGVSYRDIYTPYILNSDCPDLLKSKLKQFEIIIDLSVTYQRRIVIHISRRQIYLFLQRQATVILPPPQQYGRQLCEPKSRRQMKDSGSIFSWLCGESFGSSQRPGA